jgi:hypothetical protein
MSSLDSCFGRLRICRRPDASASSHIPQESGNIMEPLYARTVEMLEMRAPRGLGVAHSGRTCNYVREPFFFPLAIK